MSFVKFIVKELEKQFHIQKHGAVVSHFRLKSHIRPTFDGVTLTSHEQNVKLSSI